MIEYYLCNLEHNRSWLVKFLEPEIAPYFIHLIPKLKNHYPLNMPNLAHPVDNLSFVYSFKRFFENLSKSKPLVLILDDIQWMSGESIQLLKYLVKRISNQPIQFVATTRLEKDNPALEEIIDEFNTERLVFNIDLTNFSQSEVENLVNQKFETNLPNHYLHWLFTDRYRSCAGVKCLRALRNREGAFELYRGEEVEIVGYTSCGGCPGGIVEYSPAEMKKNGADVIHLATGLLVGYPPCRRIRQFTEFIKTACGLDVISGTHPIPQNYYLRHQELDTWNSTWWKNTIRHVLMDENARLSYD